MATKAVKAKWRGNHVICPQFYMDETHPIRKYLRESFGSEFLACSWKPGISTEDFDNYIQKEHPVMYINGKENEDAVE